MSGCPGLLALCPLQSGTMFSLLALLLIPFGEGDEILAKTLTFPSDAPGHKVATGRSGESAQRMPASALTPLPHRAQDAGLSA